MRALARVAVLLAAGCACGGPPPPETEHVATIEELAAYPTWTAYERPMTGLVPAHPDGVTTVFLNRLPAHGATEFPIGTILVRETRAGAREDWEVHAMVRRSEDFNPLGAVGWEYVDLRWPPDGEPGGPSIVWRGTGPETTGDGYATMAGGVQLGCNHCHGAVPQNDSIIGLELQLEDF